MTQPLIANGNNNNNKQQKKPNREKKESKQSDKKCFQALNMNGRAKRELNERTKKRIESNKNLAKKKKILA